MVALVREQIGPVAAMKTVFSVPALPKTRSGKVLRATMRKIADGEAYKHAGYDRGRRPFWSQLSKGSSLADWQ